MKNTALKIAYLGTNFHGFQRQPDFRTVEGEIIYTLKYLDLIDNTRDGRFRIAGRTDTGVHALGNVISFFSEKEIRINQINHKLPDDIKILAKAPVRYAFRPRYPYKRKYRYILFDDGLDFETMQEASQLFVGTHDFTNFSKRIRRTPIRTIDEIKLTKENKLILVDITGESFLWNMVRKMMFALTQVGKGKEKPSYIKELLENNYKANVKVMPAENLILMDTIYNGIKFQYDDYAVERFSRIIQEELDFHKKSYIIKESIQKSLKK